MAKQTFTKQSGIYILRLILESTANEAGNYSTVKYTLQFGTGTTTSGYNFGQQNKLKFVLNGATVIETNNWGRVNLNGTPWVTFASRTITVPHNQDGKKSISFSATYNQPQDGGLAISLSGTFTLDNISRASQVSLDFEAISLYDGNPGVTIYTNRVNSAYTHKLSYSIGSVSEVLAEGVEEEFKWSNVPVSLAEQFTKSNTGIAVITCSTYNGSTLIGKSTIELYLKLNTSYKPTCSFTVEEAADLPEGISCYVKGKSQWKIVATAEGILGSTISSYAIKANGATYDTATVTTGFLATAGENTITLVVTDSRGYTGEAELSVHVEDYKGPAVSDWRAYRCASDTDATETDTGAFIAVDVIGEASSLNGQNSKSLTINYKKTTEEAYTPLPVPMPDYTIAKTVIFPADADFKYDVQIVLEDSFFAPYEDATTIRAAFTLIDLLASNRGLAFGKVADTENLVDFNIPVNLRKGLSEALPIESGGTGATTAAQARENLGIVDVSDTHNIKTYSSLGQLGLSASATTEEVFAAMPANSVLQISNNTAYASSYACIADAPYTHTLIRLCKSSNAYGTFGHGTAMGVTSSSFGTVWECGWHPTNGFGGWKSIDIDAHNIKTYSSLSQLGFTAPATTAEVLAAMPSNSILEINNNTASALCISDVPYAYTLVRLSRASIYGCGDAMGLGSSTGYNKAYKCGWHSTAGFGGWKAVTLT